ncbi:MAG: AIPR family protein [Candidatus Delongbacteria bacterium]|nr:AIPR family protein [Candidatus Delongbacteria bacterium]MBN2836634.1 AIPR family protein [Candidatus Delongbacteria bacterium]
MTYEEFYEEFMQSILAEENFSESIFTKQMLDFLVEEAIIDEFTYNDIPFKHTTKGLRVDAWNYQEESGVLYLFITDFKFDNKINVLTHTQSKQIFGRLEKFFKESFKKKFVESLEESSTGFEISDFILRNEKEITELRAILLTNSERSQNFKNIPNELINGINVVHDVWDISRVFKLQTSGNERDKVSIELKKYIDRGVPALSANTGSSNYESYLIVAPGQLLADLYDDFGDRLLEQNVRTFLQFRGKVNKEIRNTIKNDPEMFFAYNNGLTATAESVEYDENKKEIYKIDNFQIVNGGQTTASLYTAFKKEKCVLNKIFVQIKLNIISKKEDVETIVPKISRFANTQNKVNATDFYSNHPYHLRIEELSRRLWATSISGSIIETHWYYERTRGQYANSQNVLTPALKKKFLNQNPKNQMFTKTDIAKYINTIDCLPHLVSLGAEKNFTKFAERNVTIWEKNELEFNELYFKRLVSKAIIFRSLDRKIMKQEWYGGYKANIVTYTLALFSHLLDTSKLLFNYEKIWQEQTISDNLENQLLIIAQIVNDHIKDTPSNLANISEWCKRERCWDEAKKIDINLSYDLSKYLQDRSEQNDKEKNAKKDQIIVNKIYYQKFVIDKGSDYWKKLSEWGVFNKFFTDKEMSILTISCQIPSKLPSESQCKILIDIEKRAIEEGFFYKKN